MAFTAKEYRAIFRVAKHLGYKLELCSKPYVFYLADDRQVKMKIRAVLDHYESLRREERRLALQHERYTRHGQDR